MTVPIQNPPKTCWLLIVSFLCGLFVLASTIHAQDNIAFSWMSSPASVTYIDTDKGLHGNFIDLKQLAELLEITVDHSEDFEKIQLSLPSGRLLFTAGTPFVHAGSFIYQMPLPMRTASVNPFAPLVPIIELLTTYYPGSIYYDPMNQRILAAKPQSDILGIRFDASDSIIKAVISLGKNRSCTPETKDDSKVNLFFSRASIDTTRKPPENLPDGIRKCQFSQTSRGAIITVECDSNFAFSELQHNLDPPLFTALFRPESNSADHQQMTRRLEEERNAWKFDTVVIDPGHGGKDPGAVGPGKIKEKDIVLDVGKRLEKILKKRKVKTIMTRSTDKFIPLTERTKIANRSGGKLFISLHCNAHKDKRARGTEVYFLSPSKTDRAMEVARLENSVIKYEESQEQYEEMSEENLILLTMAQSTFIREAQDIAGIMVEQVSNRMQLRNRGVDQAGFYVLVGASMPAILYELGFITNTREAKRLNEKRFRQKIAESIADSVIDFLAKSRNK